MKSLLIGFIFILSANGWSQSDVVLFNILASSDSSTLPCLLSRPDSVRTAVFIAATFSSGLIRLNDIQKSTSIAFQTLLSPYSHRKQKQFWEKTRHPGLIANLIKNKAKQDKNDYSTLVEMEALHQDFEMQVEALTGNFPDEFKKAFIRLIHDPEVLSQLRANMKITATLGDIYKRNPALMKRMADSLNMELAAEKSVELEDWKNGISSDALLQGELKQIAENYAAEEDSLSNQDSPGSETMISGAANTTPYPYWAGYPFWLGRNYWVPYPFWYQMGLFWSPGGAMFIFSLPSYHFGWWFLNHPPYADNHPRASAYFDNQYETHRNFNSGFNKSIREFREGIR